MVMIRGGRVKDLPGVRLPYHPRRARHAGCEESQAAPLQVWRQASEVGFSGIGMPVYRASAADRERRKTCPDATVQKKREINPDPKFGDLVNHEVHECRHV